MMVTRSSNHCLSWLLATSFALWSAAPACASKYGFSINMNFGAGQLVVDGPAGRFADRVWNNFSDPNLTSPRPLLTDMFGDLNQSAVRVQYSSESVGRAPKVSARNVNDARMMTGFLGPKSEITISGLDELLPGLGERINYAVLLYTHGGQAGQRGRFEVNGRVVEKEDTEFFDGRFLTGPRGNLVVLEDFRAPILNIRSEGFGPINAISIMYCRDGDFNGDGLIDVSDLNELNMAYKDGISEAKYDVNLDLSIDYNDVLAWIKWSKGTCIGDVNLDGVFNSSDLIQLFQKGLYETAEYATWTSGDWNGDGVFDSSDLLLAFQEGCYEADEGFIRAEAGEEEQQLQRSIPEPSGLLLFAWALLLLRRRQRFVPLACSQAVCPP
jgi:hypothetical protein